MAPRPEQLLRRLFPPMLAVLAEEPPRDEKNWTYELKYDGFRAVSAIVEGEVAMWSRNELDLAPRFPHIARALGKLRLPEIVLDGEVVALDDQGAPRFQLRKASRTHGVVVPIDNPLCTLTLSRRLDPDRQLSHRLGDLCARYGIDLVRPHHALADADATAAVLPHLLRAHGITSAAQLSVAS